MRFEYLTTKARLNWDGADFHLEVDVEKAEMDANELGKDGWELMGFFPDIHAIGDIDKGYADGRVGHVPPDERIAIFKGQIA